MRSIERGIGQFTDSFGRYCGQRLWSDSTIPMNSKDNNMIRSGCIIPNINRNYRKLGLVQYLSNTCDTSKRDFFENSRTETTTAHSGVNFIGYREKKRHTTKQETGDQWVSLFLLCRWLGVASPLQSF